jgi:hypothetical protein
VVLRSTQPVTEMSTRSLPGGKGRPARKADKLTVICELIGKCESLNVSQFYGPSRSVTATDLPFNSFTKQRTLSQVLISQQSRFNYLI